MRQIRAVLAAAMMLCAAGCQHDLALRAVDSNDTYVTTIRDVEALVIESDTRRVSLEFSPPPVDDAIDSDMVFAYLSLPLHPVRGIEFDNPGFGVGWSNTAMTFARVIEPFSRKQSVGAWDGDFFAEMLVDVPAELPKRRAATSTQEAGPVDPRFVEYAAALRELVYASGEWPAGDVLAGLPQTSPAAAADTD